MNGSYWSRDARLEQTRQLHLLPHSTMNTVDMQQLKSGEVNLGVCAPCRPIRACLTAVCRLQSWQYNSTKVWSLVQTVVQRLGAILYVCDHNNLYSVLTIRLDTGKSCHRQTDLCTRPSILLSFWFCCRYPSLFCCHCCPAYANELLGCG